MPPDNPFLCSFVLRQHTPIIHFQHYLDGATLRATEVKPLLDKFLIEELGAEVCKKWIIPHSASQKDFKALAYKLRFEVVGESVSEDIEKPYKDKLGNDKTHPYPNFFGNMGKDYKDENLLKKFEYNPQVKGSIKSMHTDLIEKLADLDLLTKFFASYNFGTRKDKGFGSFMIDGITSMNYDKPIKEVDKSYHYCFNLTGLSNANSLDRYDTLFRHIDLFYRVLRAGLNLKYTNKGTKLYIKSALFSYVKSLSTPMQWEKRIIKQTFFLKDGVKRNGDPSYSGLESQQKNREKRKTLESAAQIKQHQEEFETLYYDKAPYNLVRDLLGFSPDESWLYYDNAKIIKTEAELKAGVWKDKKSGIERYASPIEFKPVYAADNKSCTVYIRLKDVNAGMLGKDFLIKTNGQDLPISTPAQLNLHNFFTYLKSSEFTARLAADLAKYPCDEATIIDKVFTSLKKL
jgi:hypothetical protein